MVKVPTKYLILATCGAILALLCLGWYSGFAKGRKPLKSLENALNDTVAYYTVKIDGKDTYIAEKEQEITTKNELIRQGEIDRKTLRAINLKQVDEINKLKLRVDTLLEDVGHDGTVVVVHDTVTNTPANAILLPFDFTKKDEWLELKGKFDPQGKLSIGLTMVADVNVYTGYDKTAKSYKSVVTSDSPYLQTIGIKSFKLDLKKPTRYGIGLQIGYGVSLSKGQVIASPYIGFGLSLNILRF